MDEENVNFKWELVIRKVKNGFILSDNEGEVVLEDDEEDNLTSCENLLWYILEYFGYIGSKHDPERLRIIREKRDENE